MIYPNRKNCPLPFGISCCGRCRRIALSRDNRDDTNEITVDSLHALATRFRLTEENYENE